MKAQEEYENLRVQRLEEKLGRSKDKFVCLLAEAPARELSSGQLEVPENLRLAETVVVGTLDVVVARAIKGEVLIGDEKAAAYLANVCTADVARRRGVARALIAAACNEARDLGVKTVYVHLMAVNESGRALYRSCGFELEKEESSNDAHYRGHCLDGVEGLGRTVLLKASLD